MTFTEKKLLINYAFGYIQEDTESVFTHRKRNLLNFYYFMLFKQKIINLYLTYLYFFNFYELYITCD